MKTISNILAIVVLMSAFVLPFVEDSMAMKIEAVYVLINMALLAALGIGIGWHSAIKGMRLNDPNDYMTMREAITSHNAWFAYFIPRIELARALNYRKNDKNEIAADLFFSPLVFLVLLIGLGGILAIELHEERSRGFFGALLEFKLGQSISLLFAFWMAISSFAVLTVGMIFKINHWRFK